MTKWYFIETLVNFIQVFITFKIFELYYDRRFKFKYSMESVIILMTAVLCLINFNISLKLIPYISLIFILLIYIFTIIIFKGNILLKASTTFLIMAVLGTCELLTAVFISSISGLDLKLIQEQSFVRLEVMIISQTIFVYIYMFIKKKVSKEKLSILNNKYYYFLVVSILFLTVTVMFIVIWMYGNIKIDNENVNDNLVILTLCVSLISIISIALTTRIIKDMDEKHKNDIELQHMKMEHTYFEDVNSVLEEIRILRHDMRGELAIIHGYNELNQRDKIKSHIEKKLHDMDVQLLPKFDNNNIITSFLNFKFKEVMAKNITIDFQNTLSEENEINIDKEDICRMLNNIINNAIEACNNCDEKYIKLQLNMMGKCIIIKSENPFKGEINKTGNKILTIKKDKTKHGYGLKSIKSIAEKYGGFMKVNYDNNIFVLEVQMLVNLSTESLTI